MNKNVGCNNVKHVWYIVDFNILLQKKIIPSLGAVLCILVKSFQTEISRVAILAVHSLVISLSTHLIIPPGHKSINDLITFSFIYSLHTIIFYFFICFKQNYIYKFTNIFLFSLTNVFCTLNDPLNPGSL